MFLLLVVQRTVCRSGVLSIVIYRSEVNLGLPPAEGKARFGRTSSEESMKSCVASRSSEEFSLLNEVSYVLDGRAGDELRAKAGEMGQSLGESLNR